MSKFAKKPPHLVKIYVRCKEVLYTLSFYTFLTISIPIKRILQLSLISKFTSKIEKNKMWFFSKFEW